MANKGLIIVKNTPDLGKFVSELRREDAAKAIKKIADGRRRIVEANKAKERFLPSRGRLGAPLRQEATIDPVANALMARRSGNPQWWNDPKEREFFLRMFPESKIRRTK